MKTKRLFAIPIGVVILLALMALPASAAVVGKFTSLEGSVDITSTGKDARPAATGDPVAVGDFIRTKSKSRCEITYLDGNIIRLAEASRLRVTEYSLEKNNQKLDLLRGKVQSIVKTAAEVTGVAKGGRFEVHTPTAVAGVRGTNFFTYYQAGVSGATFKEGRGYGYSSNRPQDVRPISPGQTMVVTSPDVPPVVRPATSNELQRHEKDTAPAEKPKEKAEKEEDKAAPAAGQPAPQEEAKKPVTEEAPKIVYASRPADLQEQSKAVDIVARTEPVAASPTPAPAPPPPPPPPIDSTPPVITIIPQNPAAITNRTSAAFAVETNETASISYSLNGSSFVIVLPGGNISLANIPEGKNTFTVKATDLAGNASTASYSWTTDYTPPAITLSGTPALITNLRSANIGVSATDATAVSYTYKLDSNVVASPNLTGIPEGNRTFTVIATDAAGNQTTLIYPWFIGKRQYVLRDLQGGVTGGVAGDLSGAVQASSEGIRVISTLPAGSSTGAWLLDLQGSYTSLPAGSLTLVAGGKGYGPYYPENTVSIVPSTPSDGYWLSRIDGTAAQGTLTGTSNLSYLSPTTLGKGIGQVTGIYGSGNWQASGVGTYNETPLQFGSAVGVLENNGFQELSFDPSSGYSLNPDSQITGMTGLLGGVSNLWTAPAQFTMMGRYANPRGRTFWGIDMVSKDTVFDPNYPCAFNIACQGLSATGTSFQGVGYHGLIGGLALNNTLKGKGIAIYIRPGQVGAYDTGYLKLADISGFFHEGSGMWEATGNIAAISKGTTTIAPANLYEGSQYLQIKSDSIPINDGPFHQGILFNEAYFLANQNWGVTVFGMAGKYQSIPNGLWEAKLGKHEKNEGTNWYKNYFLGTITGGQWDSNTATFSARLTGRELNMDFFNYNYLGTWNAEIIGDFDSNTFQAVGIGSGEAHPLVYGGALAGDFSNWDFSGDNLLSQVPNSNATGLLGGTESLFLNPTQGVFASKPFIALGTYNPEATGSLFLSEIRGGGTIFGIGRFGLYVGGVRLPDTNIFRTQALGLYFRPTQNTYEAGVLASGAFDTHFYPNLAMWEMPLEPAKLQATMMNENFQGGEVEINEASIFGRVAGGGYLLGSAQALKNSQGVEYWGIFTAAFGGQGSLSSQAMGNLKMGGIIIPEGEDNPLAYWIGSASPALPQDGVGYFTGSLDGYFLGGTRGDFAGGSLLGMASDGSYQGILGGPYRENEMAFVAVANQSEAFFTAASSLQFSGHIHGFGGARTSPFSEASSLMLLGVYYNPDNYPLFRTTITGEDSNGFSFMSAVRGFALPEGNGAMVGKLIGPYLRQTGTTFELGVLLSGDVPIGAYAGINPLLLPGGGMWETDGGNLRGYPLATGLTSSQTPIVENWTGSGLNDPASFVTGFAGSLTLTFRDETSFNFAGQPWHLIASTIGGTYHVDNGSGPGVGTSLRWHANDAHTIVQLDTVNTIGDSKVFSGTLQGAVVDWQLAKTFVQGGEIRGLFDPATTWKAVYTGAWMETGKFMDMVTPMNEAQRAAFQEATKIPAIEVGKTTLAGTGNNLSVTLRDVTFFRSSTGTNPLIWAVQGITGTTTGTPVPGTAVPLNATSGGNITGSFTPHNWTTTQWGASVTGAGSLNRTDGIGGATVPVNFTGGAVGVLSGTSFSGSGAGIVIPP